MNIVIPADTMVYASDGLTQICPTKKETEFELLDADERLIHVALKKQRFIIYRSDIKK